MELQGLLVLAVAVFINYMLLVLIQNMFAVSELLIISVAEKFASLQ